MQRHDQDMRSPRTDVLGNELPGFDERRAAGERQLAERQLPPLCSEMPEGLEYDRDFTNPGGR